MTAADMRGCGPTPAGHEPSVRRTSSPPLQVVMAAYAAGLATAHARASGDELDTDGRVVDAERLGPVQQLFDSLPALLAVVARQLVDVHADEAVGEVWLEAAAELHRVGQRL